MAAIFYSLSVLLGATISAATIQPKSDSIGEVSRKGEELLFSGISETPLRHPYCPLVDDINHPVHFAYPDDCNKYYSCLQGFAHVMLCPDNLHWSSLTYRCDYAEVANCNAISEHNTTATTPVLTPVPTAPSAIDSFKYTTYPGDCSKFQRCQVLSCPERMHWNPHLSACDFPTSSQCTDGGIALKPTTQSAPSAATPPATATTQITPTISPASANSSNTVTADYLNTLCSKSGQQYVPYPADCHRFIQCNGWAFVHSCPDNLLWNSELATCDRFCK